MRFARVFCFCVWSTSHVWLCQDRLYRWRMACMQGLVAHEPALLCSWRELRKEEYYCKLCWAFATERHVASAKHQRKYEWLQAQSDPLLAMQQWEQEHAQQHCEVDPMTDLSAMRSRVPAVSGEKTSIKIACRDNPEWHCIHCNELKVHIRRRQHGCRGLHYFWVWACPHGRSCKGTCSLRSG